MQKKIRSSLFIGITAVALGLFLLVVCLGFLAEEHPSFNIQGSGKIGHFLGPAGVAISSFLIYFLGCSAYIFALLIVYTGYIFLRKVSRLKRIGFIFIAASCGVISMVLFSLFKSATYHGGGGSLGAAIARALLRHGRKEWLIPVFTILFLGCLFILFRYPAGFIIHYFRDREKPPLFRKVYYDERELPLRPAHPAQPVVPGRRGRKVPSERSLKPDIPAMEKGPESSGVQDRSYAFPDSSILRKSTHLNRKEKERETARKANELERTLREFGIEAKVVGIIRGPVITRYELQPAPGVKLSRIVNLSNNIALNLSANGVRIEAPIPGRSAVGIEIPNEEREIVTLGDVFHEAPKSGELPLILGKDISGNVVVSDLAAMPHLLIAGATGSGKSVCVNSLIVSLLFQKDPEEIRFLLIDPKMVELKGYNGIPHLLTEVVTDPRDVAKAFKWLLYEMENRYVKLDENYARNIAGYNQKAKERMPYIVVIIDEFASLVTISQKEVEDAVVRLAAMSRAVGIHLIMATQRPSVDIITGLIKANFPYRIAFQVASKIDSRTILDVSGAEKLLGRGDMLFAPAGSMNIQRIQGALIAEDEVFQIVEELKRRGSPDYVEDIWSFEKDEDFDADYDDPIFDQAVEIVLKTKRASASFLQRRLKIGYNRAARLIELMEEEGIIGPPRGSKPREVYIERSD